MFGSRVCDTPIEFNQKLSDDSNGAMVDKGDIRDLVGSSFISLIHVLILPLL